MKQATIEYETEAGGKRIAVLESIDIAGDDPMIVLGGIIIALSDRVAALEKRMGNSISANVGMNTPPELTADEQLEMDLQP